MRTVRLLICTLLLLLLLGTALALPLPQSDQPAPSEVDDGTKTAPAPSEVTPVGPEETSSISAEVVKADGAESSESSSESAESSESSPTAESKRVSPKPAQVVAVSTMDPFGLEPFQAYTLPSGVGQVERAEVQTGEWTAFDPLQRALKPEEIVTPEQGEQDGQPRPDQQSV